ncbi:MULTISPECIES: hypothetical protein [unclassified Nostoc]|uniref:hypothetical protein n=1 Tax=unclassified Nostoc TaxID=2593658 RepID=UPI001683CD3C|nr:MULTISPECIES: hypothetical protein [unclassified Nostoc]MBD2469239.1 hypothetical protein [Nostoc sp. FACHB-145]
MKLTGSLTQFASRGLKPLHFGKFSKPLHPGNASRLLSGNPQDRTTIALFLAASFFTLIS